MALDVPHDRGGAPSLLVRFSLPVLVEQCDLKPVTWEAEHSSSKSVQVCHTLRVLFPPPGLAWKSHLLFQTESSFRCERRPDSYSVNRGNLRAVINTADPVQGRCIPALATIKQRTQAGRQAGPGLGHPLHSHIIPAVQRAARLDRNPHHSDRVTKLRP